MEEVLRVYYSSPRNPIGMEDADFYTSADLDPVFGEMLARQFTRWATDFDSFTIVELGAGKGDPRAQSRDARAAGSRVEGLRRPLDR